MTVISAVSMSADLILPPDGPVGEVQTVFKDYVNVVTSSGLVSFVNRGRPHIPFGIEIEFGGIAVKAQAPVSKIGNRFIIGETLTVEGLDQCSRYSCSPAAGCRIGDEVMTERLVALRQLCYRSTRFGGLTGYFRKDGNTEEASLPAAFQTVAQRFAPCLRSLVAGIRRNDHFLIVEGAHGLLGVGPGLTPSGDDFLVGFLGGVMSSRPENCRAAAVTLANCLARDAAALTTSLSAEYIRFAAKGLYHEYVTGFINAFKLGSPAELEQAARQLLTLGHFSGTDLLFGFSYGGLATLQTEREDGLLENI